MSTLGGLGACPPEIFEKLQQAGIWVACRFESPPWSGFFLQIKNLIVVLPHLILIGSHMALGKHVLQANAFCVSLPVPNW